jgi:hypothetical protein
MWAFGLATRAISGEGAQPCIHTRHTPVSSACTCSPASWQRMSKPRRVAVQTVCPSAAHVHRACSEDEARDTFKTLKNLHIASRSAALYADWAQLEAKSGNTSKAVGVLQKGLSEGAQPARCVPAHAHWCVSPLRVQRRNRREGADHVCSLGKSVLLQAARGEVYWAATCLPLASKVTARVHCCFDGASTCHNLD